MPIWIFISVAAALLQCWRTAMQQKLRNLLSVNGAGFVRYLYGMPTAAVLLVIAVAITGDPIPAINPLFLLYCVFLLYVCMCLFLILILNNRTYHLLRYLSTNKRRHYYYIWK